MNTNTSSSRNPFGVEDAPDPDGVDIEAFAENIELHGGPDDPNAPAWGTPVNDAPSSIVGARQALLDVRYVDPDTLVGRYINLSNPAITQPWVGLIVDNRRIDGRWPNGRLDFRR